MKFEVDIKTDVKTCARCTREHKQLTLQDLNRHHYYTHFITCPDTNQPIFIRIIVEIEGEKD